MINSEVVQFAEVAQISGSRWRLSGLLRGRGGTEAAAQVGHAVGAPATLIDDSLIVLDAADLPNAASPTIAAIGRGDDAPVIAVLENAGLSQRPPCPVHPRKIMDDDGSWTLCWKRRARGAWSWPDEVDAPMVEQVEAYRVGVGSIVAPDRVWDVSSDSLSLRAATIADLAAENPGESIWVRQIGNHAQSDALLLATLP